MANYCPNCGAAVSSGDSYCASCGAALRGGAASGTSGATSIGSAVAAGAAGALGTLVAVTLVGGLTRNLYYYGGRYFLDPFCRRPFMGRIMGGPRPMPRGMGPHGGMGGPHGGMGPHGGGPGGRR